MPVFSGDGENGQKKGESMTLLFNFSYYNFLAVVISAMLAHSVAKLHFMTLWTFNNSRCTYFEG